MLRNEKSFVIAITGASGAGKTSLVNQVAALFDDAVCFYFDDYEATHQQPEDNQAWAERRFDPHLWKNPRLLEDLRLLSHGASVTPPGSSKVIEPASVIVMEEPFGRTREGMDQLVDFVACIDVPLEIALARRLLRELEWVIQKKTGEKYAKGLRRHLDWYLNKSGRDMYYQVNENAKEDCHLVLDGGRLIPELAHEVVEHVNRIMRTEA